MGVGGMINSKDELGSTLSPISMTVLMVSESLKPESPKCQVTQEV